MKGEEFRPAQVKLQMALSSQDSAFQEAPALQIRNRVGRALRVEQ